MPSLAGRRDVHGEDLRLHKEHRTPKPEPASGTSLTGPPITQKGSTFLNVAAEVRNLVFSLLLPRFSPPRPAAQAQAQTPAWDEANILLVCRQLYLECGSLVHSRHRRIHADSTTEHAGLSNKVWALRGVAVALKSLELQFNAFLWHRSARVLSYLARTPGLRLEFLWIRLGVRYSHEIIGYILKCVKSFMQLRRLTFPRANFAHLGSTVQAFRFELDDKLRRMSGGPHARKWHAEDWEDVNWPLIVTTTKEGRAPKETEICFDDDYPFLPSRRRRRNKAQ